MSAEDAAQGSSYSYTRLGEQQDVAPAERLHRAVASLEYAVCLGESPHGPLWGAFLALRELANSPGEYTDETLADLSALAFITRRRRTVLEDRVWQLSRGLLGY